MAISAPILRLVAAALIAVAAAGGALAQDKPGNWLTRLLQPSSSSAVPGSTNGAREWSGQSGASGNPLMTADAIRAAAADFGNCLSALWPQAERRGVTRANFEHYTAGLTPDLSIMDLLDSQPEFNKPGIISICWSATIASRAGVRC
jgi:membrane-bound lytic murein transglycosylase B